LLRPNSPPLESAPSSQPIPLGGLEEGRPSLYVHLPFCVSRCNYCDFNAWTYRGQSFTRYVDALLQEAEKRVANLNPQTVFLGGGTPSLLPAEELARLLSSLDEITGFRNSAIEVSMEANPESLDFETATAARKGGVNRISIGVQSLQTDVLRAYERAHSPEVALQALQMAREIFPRMNADLIFGFPGQNPDTFFSDLNQVLAENPDHLSCYELTYEPGTPLTRKKDAGKWQAEDPDLCEKLFLETAVVCKDNGLFRYEISNYAKPGEACLHNLAAWRSFPYLGIGAGASSWWEGSRRQNLLNPQDYENAVFQNDDPCGFEEKPNNETILFDLVMMGLRLPEEGVSLARIGEQSGLDLFQIHGPLLSDFEKKGWLVITETHVRVTSAGMLLLDTMLEQLLPKASV